MYRVNAFTRKGTKFRFRIQAKSIQEVRATLDQIFADKEMQLVLVEPLTR
ncbi:MAG: hypothetical protein H6999_04520 [Hahellaceae bacterium]|nr:hypothetical protein [Hahellaceae bacterium]MCP5169001.1 hypothetical protein [Hahellaceae bacterium]